MPGDDDDYSLFAENVRRPLADRLRPVTLDDIVGQDHLLGPDGPLRRMIDGGKISSFILWGPPGCGKTTCARIMAKHTNMNFVAISAVFSGIAELRKAFEEAKRRRAGGEGTLLFVDEIHRFNRAQQDGFLPYVENGTVTLVGATTENPSFELNSALLSRCKVFVMNPLDASALEKIVVRAEKETGRTLCLSDEARSALLQLADGDGRYFINLIETVFDLTAEGEKLDSAGLMKIVQQRAPGYDKSGDGHYNLISALHKSLRGSDPDAALYWAARMIHAGEDPLYLLRRLTRFAMEDVSLADPNALQFAISAWDAYERLGSPEGDIAIAELVIYLGTAPKSNSVVMAIDRAMADVAAGETGPFPRELQNVHADGAGFEREQGYKYPHDYPSHYVKQQYLPDRIKDRVYYEYGDNKTEQAAKAYWDKIKEKD